MATIILTIPDAVLPRVVARARPDYKNRSARELIEGEKNVRNS